MQAQSDTYWGMLINRSVQRFFLLSALHRHPMHGYELARSIKEACAGCCEPTDAMIYPAIHDLLEGGYAVCHDETVTGRHRKVCRLTEKGEEAYRTAAGAWQRVLGPLVDAVQTALEASPQAAPCCPAATKGDQE